MTDWLAIFIGGGLGSLSRYGISKLLGTSESGFPTGTFIANLLACLVLGVAFYLFARRSEAPSAFSLFILTGFCGGFSTFSTFSMETFLLLQSGQISVALVYVGASIFACLFTLWIISQIMT